MTPAMTPTPINCRRDKKKEPTGIELGQIPADPYRKESDPTSIIRPGSSLQGAAQPSTFLTEIILSLLPGGPHFFSDFHANLKEIEGFRYLSHALHAQSENTETKRLGWVGGIKTTCICIHFFPSAAPTSCHPLQLQQSLSP
jgi:hypothetical protein